MNRTYNLHLHALAIALLAASCLALSQSHAQAKGNDGLSVKLVCPVTGLSIASPAVAVGKSVYKGKTYYFCTSNCKRLFDKDPAKYAKAH